MSLSYLSDDSSIFSFFALGLFLFCCLILKHEVNVLLPSLMGLQVLWQKGKIIKDRGGGGMNSVLKS